MAYCGVQARTAGMHVYVSMSPRAHSVRVCVCCCALWCVQDVYLPALRRQALALG